MASESVIQTEFEYTGYGKNYVKLLYLRRDGDIHFVKELEVSTELTLNNVKDYTHGDNSDIIATDSQKNTVYVMAKQHGVCIEGDHLLVCDDAKANTCKNVAVFIYTYHLKTSQIILSERIIFYLQLNIQYTCMSFIVFS